MNVSLCQAWRSATRQEAGNLAAQAVMLPSRKGFGLVRSELFLLLAFKSPGLKALHLATLASTLTNCSWFPSPLRPALMTTPSSLILKPEYCWKKQTDC